MAEYPGDEGNGDGDGVIGGEGGNSSDGSEYELTAAEVLENLEQAWQNEKFAPELLEHKTEIVECILEQIREMEENLSHVKKGDFVAGIHQLELDRIRFVLCSYLRTRLQKIEKFVVHTLEQEATAGVPSRLSAEELVYAKEFAGSMESHFQSLVLKHMPSNFQKIDRKKAISRPNMDSYVFMRALKKTDQVVVDNEDEGADTDAVDFDPGDQYILKYRPIATLVHSGVVKLV